jgi:hypothetical protein
MASTMRPASCAPTTGELSGSAELFATSCALPLCVACLPDFGAVEGLTDGNRPAALPPGLSVAPPPDSIGLPPVKPGRAPTGSGEVPVTGAPTPAELPAAGGAEVCPGVAPPAVAVPAGAAVTVVAADT